MECWGEKNVKEQGLRSNTVIKRYMPPGKEFAVYSTGGFPRWHSGRESACQRRRCKRHRLNPWVRNIPWRRKRQLTPVFLPRESHGQRSLAGYSPWGRKKSDTTEQLIFYFIFYSLANAGYTGLIPGPGRSHMSQGS